MRGAHRVGSDRHTHAIREVGAIVDVVVVTYNSAASVEACLQGARAASVVGTIVVVDNASRDDSVQMAQAAGADVILRNTANVGFARAANQGVAATTSESILLLNPDAVVDEDALLHMSALLLQRQDVAIVAPLLLSETGAITAGAGRSRGVARRVGLCLPLVGRLPVFRPQYDVRSLSGDGATGAVPVDYVFGAVMLVDRSFFRAAGGFDERFFFAAEDEDLCRRAWRAGKQVVLDSAVVVRHVGGASCTEAARTEAQRLFSIYRFLAKWEGDGAARRYYLGTRVALGLREAAAALVGDRGKRMTVAEMRRTLEEAYRSGADPLRTGTG